MYLIRNIPNYLFLTSVSALETLLHTTMFTKPNWQNRYSFIICGTIAQIDLCKN